MNPRRHSPIPHVASRRQRGAATLIVVMLLFFIISMVAAYTSRNLIFEQRTSANQYRSTQAFEAAEAGLEWAIAQLNAGRTTNSCAASTNDGSATEQSFAQRYLAINASTGEITPRVASGGGSVQPRCVFDSSDVNPANWTWTCNCPVPTATSTGLSAPGGTGPAPAFIVRLRRSADVGSRTDLIQLEANSCTRLDLGSPSCLSFASDRGGTGDGVAANVVLLALRGALTRPPAAALTVAGALAALPGGATLSLVNEEAAASGLTLHTSGGEPAGITKRTIAGTPPASSVVSGDASLAPAAAGTLSTEDRRFVLFYGVRPDTYFRQPGMVEVDCSAGCDAADVNLALLRNPGRAIRVTGAGTLTIDADIGSVAAPALLIVEGDVDFSSGVTLVGLLYGRKAAWTWTVNGAATIRGAAVAEGGLTLTGGGGATSITYDTPVLTALRVSYGTFVRVPGSWKDFQ